MATVRHVVVISRHSGRSAIEFLGNYRNHSNRHRQHYVVEVDTAAQDPRLDISAVAEVRFEFV